jgi:glycosyltransferase involved in cell wall biosynthesis
MTKRILIFSLAYHPHVGGAEIAIKEITDRLSDFEFHVVTLRFSRHDKKEEKLGNVMVHRVPAVFGMGHFAYLSKIFFVVGAARKAQKLHTEKKFGAVWAMMTFMLFPTLVARLLGLRAPYVVTLQDGDPFEYVFERWYIRPFVPLLTYGFKHANMVTTISIHLSGWAKRLGYSKEVVIIPNGFNAKGFDSKKWFSIVGEQTQERVAYWRNQQDLEIVPQTVMLITTSRLVEKNAIDTVIRAVALLPQEVHFAIFGKGEKEKELRGLVNTLRLQDRVHFCGEIKNTAVAYALRASDIFVRPSRSEGMGNSFIEAMAAGVPVIATQVGGIGDFLFDPTRNPGVEPTGFAVDSDSPEQIAKRVQYILEHHKEVERVVQNAKCMVEEKYSWDTIAHDMQEKVFEPLVYNIQI